MSNAALQFGVLGPLQLRDGDALVPLGAPKQRAVLATLLMSRNRAVSVDALIDAVWDQSPVPAARTSIHSYVSKLRRLLGSDTIDGRSNLRLRLGVDARVDIEDAIQAAHRAESRVALGQWKQAWGPSLVALFIAEREFLPGESAEEFNSELKGWADDWKPNPN